MTNALLLFFPLLLFLILGVPIVFGIIASSAVFLLITGMKPLVLIAQQSIVGMDSLVLIAVPLFTFSGYLMEKAGLSQRLVNWAETLFGRMRGSNGVITLVCCAFFAALTGSGPATVAAIGAIMMPALVHSGYPQKDAAGMLAAGGALGPIIPPSIAMIVYGSTMSLSIPDMFIGAVVPGFLILASYLVVHQIQVKRLKIQRSEERYTSIQVLNATWKALPVILLPIIVLGGIYGGIFTPTEAATVCVVYSLVLGIVYKTINKTVLLEAMLKTVTTSSTIALIVGVSGAFGKIMAAARIPTMLTQQVVPLLGSATAYMVVLMVLLFIVGCIMETLSSIVILAPLLVPIGLELGIDPLHLGVIFCVTLVVGFITPPFGINLFTAVSTTGVKYTDVVKGVLPYMIAAMIMCIIMAFVPDIVLLLPRFMK